MESWLFSKSRGIALIGFLALAVSAVLAHRDVAPAAEAEIRQWVSAEYVRHLNTRSDLSPAERVELGIAAHRPEIRAIEARGSASMMSFKVELGPNPAAPPDAPLIRYYRMRYSPVIGWRGPPETGSEFAHFLALFFL